MVERGDRGRGYRQRVLHWGQTHSKFDKHVATHKATELCPVSQSTCSSPTSLPSSATLAQPSTLPLPSLRIAARKLQKLRLFTLSDLRFACKFIKRRVSILFTPAAGAYTPHPAQFANRPSCCPPFVVCPFALCPLVALCCVCSAASAAHKTHFRSAYPVCNRFQNVQRTDVTGRGVSNFAKLLKRVRGGSVG